MSNEKGQELLELADIITKREYNWGLVRSRQFAESLIRRLCDENGVAYTTMADSIEALYQDGAIDEASRCNFHNIRILGNKAVHEGNNDQGDAKNAYYLLREELQKASGKTRKISYERTPVQYTRPVREDDDREESANHTPRRRGRDEGDIDIHMAGNRRRTSGQKQTKKQKQSSGGIFGILKILVPVLIAVLFVVLIISLVRMSSGEEEPETTVIETSESIEEETTEETTEEETTEPPTTEEPTTEPPVQYKVKGDGVRVRYASEPERVYTTLDSGTLLGAAEDYETDKADYQGFAKVWYDGQELIIKKDFIEPVQ